MSARVQRIATLTLASLLVFPVHVTAGDMLAAAPRDSATVRLADLAGRRVRVSAPFFTRLDQEWLVVAASPDTLRLSRSTAKPPMAVPASAILQMQISEGTRRSASAGLGRGMLIGTFVGLLAGVIAYESADHSSSCGNEEFICFDLDFSGLLPLGGAAAGALLGGGVGFALGRNIEHWRTVTLEREPRPSAP